MADNEITDRGHLRPPAPLHNTNDMNQIFSAYDRGGLKL